MYSIKLYIIRIILYATECEYGVMHTESVKDDDVTIRNDKSIVINFPEETYTESVKVTNLDGSVKEIRHINDDVSIFNL